MKKLPIILVLLLACSAPAAAGWLDQVITDAVKGATEKAVQETTDTAYEKGKQTAGEAVSGDSSSKQAKPPAREETRQEEPPPPPKPAVESKGKSGWGFFGLGGDGDSGGSSDVDADIPAGKLARPYGVAVIIGNQNYAAQNKGIANVDFAGRDAKAMRDYVEKVMGYDPKNIIYQLDASSGDLRNIFGSKENPQGMLHNFIRGGETEVFVYYVGHGAPGPDGKTSFLVPVDAKADYIANNGYPLDLFYQVLDKLEVRNLTVVMDACFSGDSAGGPLFSKISPAMLKTAKPVREMADSVIFTSADKDQVATWYQEKRHSLFTYFFLKGLRGEADANKDKSITAGEMKEYLAKEVPYWAQREANRKQNPLVVGKASAVLAELR